jgi:hypothetical protein
VFLWSWLAACLNHLWERRFARRTATVTAVALVLVFGSLTVWGGLRMMTDLAGC